MMKLVTRAAVWSSKYRQHINTGGKFNLWLSWSKSGRDEGGVYEGRDVGEFDSGSIWDWALTLKLTN